MVKVVCGNKMKGLDFGLAVSERAFASDWVGEGHGLCRCKVYELLSCLIITVQVMKSAVAKALSSG